jgi:hypothetical protein
LTVSQTGRTRILIFGAQAWSLSELFGYLESVNISLGDISVFIPTLVLELQARWFTATINSLRQRIRTIEDTTGMRKPICAQDLQQPAQNWKELDMVPITGELSSLLSRFSFLKMQAETALYLIQRIYQHAVGGPGCTISDQNGLLVKLENTRGWYLGLVAQCDYLMRRTSAQTETVCSSL